MMSAFASFVDFLLPVLVQIFGLILGGLLFSLSRLARQRWGIEIEAAHREALHLALMSGVRAALARGLNGPAAAASAVAYAGRSVPDALSALKPGEGVLASIAEAKLVEAAPQGSAASAPAAPRREEAGFRPDPRWSEIQEGGAYGGSDLQGEPRWAAQAPVASAPGEPPRGPFTRPVEERSAWR